MRLLFDPQAPLSSPGKPLRSNLGVKREAQGHFNNLWLCANMSGLQATSTVCSAKDTQLQSMSTKPAEAGRNTQVTQGYSKKNGRKY